MALIPSSGCVVGYFGNNLADPRSEIGDAHEKRGGVCGNFETNLPEANLSNDDLHSATPNLARLQRGQVAFILAITALGRLQEYGVQG